MYLINDEKTLVFSLLSRRSHLSAWDHERHLVSLMRITFFDVETGQSMTLVPGRSFSACILAAMETDSN